MNNSFLTSRANPSFFTTRFARRSPAVVKDPKSPKNQATVEGMFERSIKVSWSVARVDSIPSSKALEMAFAKNGDIDKVMMTEKEVRREERSDVALRISRARG